jgi:hypothetical protein
MSGIRRNQDAALPKEPGNVSGKQVVEKGIKAINFVMPAKAGIENYFENTGFLPAQE